MPPVGSDDTPPVGGNDPAGDGLGESTAPAPKKGAKAKENVDA